MNIIKNSVLLILSSLSILACNDGAEVNMDKTGLKPESALEHAEKHLDSRYVCPMHPQIIKDQPDSCPICGMDLVKVEMETEETKPAAVKEKKILYWVAPMDPNYRRDEPGKSPMGMDLVAVYAEDETGQAKSTVLTVSISPQVEQNMGVRTAQVKRGSLAREIDTVGYIDFDESKLRHVHMRTDGWIEDLKVKSEGERVKRGDTLFRIYSPTLVNAQEEYIQSLKVNNRPLISASRDRLLALGLTQQQIKQINKSRKAYQKLAVYAQQDGIIANLNVREGMYVKPKNEVMTIADLSSVWLLAEIFEQQVEWVKNGNMAQVRLSYLPGRVWQGRVEYIYPSLDPKTRTLKVRLKFDNPDETLKPNMYANVRLFGESKEAVLYLPSEAIIRTGQEQRVIIKQENGRFSPRIVMTGMESGKSTEVMSGVNENEWVVTSGQFLIDSEASLKASLMRMMRSSN